MEKSESFALQMRIYRSLVFKWSRDESNQELKDRVYKLEKSIIEQFYPDQMPLGFSNGWSHES